MSETKPKDDILRREVRFSWHLPKRDDRPDYHYVREDVTYKDGRVEPRAYFVKDFQRPVWTTVPAARNHKDKKEFELRDNLLKRDCTQSDINRVVAGMLGQPHLANTPDVLKSSPYVYGYDITSTSLIKLQSLRRNNFIQSKFSVAAFDIETDIHTEEILMATVAMKDKVHVSMVKKFVKNIGDPTARIQKALEKYLPDYAQIPIKITYHDNEVDLLKAVFKTANLWKPALLVIWNMDFDIGRIMDRLKLANVNPIDVICDQSIPRQMRVCRYRQGLKKKVTASGVVKPINPSLQWHTLIATTPFYVIDAMCVYRQLRIAKQEEPSYSLDAILTKELKKTKLKFEEANEYKGAKWHIFMQTNYPVEYTVYNIFDCLGMLELDEKTNDLASTMPAFAGITDFQKFNSQVRKISDAMFLFGLERGKIIGTVGKIDKPEEEADADDIDAILSDEDDGDENDPSKYQTLGLSGWIQILPQNLLLNEGLQVLEEFPNVTTNLRGLTFDMDATSSYPSCTLVSNASKATCVNELIRVDGVTEETFREQNLSICLGNSNLLEYFEVLFNLPALEEITDELIEQYL